MAELLQLGWASYVSELDLLQEFLRDCETQELLHSLELAVDAIASKS